MKLSLSFAMLLFGCAGAQKPAPAPLAITSLDQIPKLPIVCAGTRQRMVKDLVDTRVRGDASNYYYAAETYAHCTLPAFERSPCPKYAAQMRVAKDANDGPAYFRASESYLACTNAPDDNQAAQPASGPRGL